MNLVKLAAISFVAFALALSCAPPQSELETTTPEVDVAQLEAALEQANLKFEEAVKNQDAAALAALYTSDAVLLPPGGGIVRGAAGAEELWESVMTGMGMKAADLITVELEVLGDGAVEIGEAVLTLEPEGGEATTGFVKYIVIWKKENGTWKLYRDIWNEMPAPEQQGEEQT